MFYEEMMIDGEWHYRTTPDGEWRKGRKSANTPAPISVERLRELLAVSSLRLPLCQFGAHVDGADGDTVADCYYNAAHEQDGRDVAELFAAAVNALPTLLHQLAERGAEVERLRNGAEREQLNLLTQLREAQRAREEACGLLRDVWNRDGGKECQCINISRDTEREYENGHCPHQRIAALLAAWQDSYIPGEGK